MSQLRGQQDNHTSLQSRHFLQQQSLEIEGQQTDRTAKPSGDSSYFILCKWEGICVKGRKQLSPIQGSHYIALTKVDLDRLASVC